MVARRREVVKLIMWEIGKSLVDFQKEFDRTVEYIRATIDALKDLDNSNSPGSLSPTARSVRSAARRWASCCAWGRTNYPASQRNLRNLPLIPALIMGNTVVFKPPKYGVLLFYPLLEAFRSAFPKGVINIVYGRGSDRCAAAAAARARSTS